MLPEISLQEFKNVELVVGQIKSVEDHPAADKLYLVAVDIGSSVKKVVAGVRQRYSKEDLLDKKVILVNNLQPAVIRGQESTGMILFASSDDKFSLISPEKEVPNGSIVK